jgi:hypothetical protein
MEDRYHRLLESVLSAFPTSSNFSVVHFVKELSNEEYYRICHNSQFGKESDSEVVDKFLRKNDFVVDGKATDFSLRFRNSDFVELTSKGILLQRAGSYKKYLEVSKRDFDANHSDNWRKKHWLLIAGLTAIVSAVLGLLAGVYLEKLGQQSQIERTQLILPKMEGKNNE